MDAHRLMRDRHRRQILNRLRQHKNEDAEPFPFQLNRSGRR
jgi:hypothetical protein